MPTQSPNTSVRMGCEICSETGTVILYLSLDQLENITYMVNQVGSLEENATERDGEFLCDELSVCVDRAASDLDTLSSLYN